MKGKGYIKIYYLMTIKLFLDFDSLAKFTSLDIINHILDNNYIGYQFVINCKLFYKPLKILYFIMFDDNEQSNDSRQSDDSRPLMMLLRCLIW